MSDALSTTESMATLWADFRGYSVPVTYHPEILTAVQAQQAIDSPQFQQWLQKCSKDERLCLKSILIQSVDFFGPRKVGFVKIQSLCHLVEECESTEPARSAIAFDDDLGGDGDCFVPSSGAQNTTRPSDKPLPGICFLRGNAVTVLFVLLCRNDEGESEGTPKAYTVLVEQPRVPLGSSRVLELPAGMLDDTSQTLAGIAIQELQQECGISIRDASELVDLTELAFQDNSVWGLAPSPGGCDEECKFLYLEKWVTPQQLQDLQGRLTGERLEGEYIRLKVVPLDTAWKVSADPKAIIATFLVERLRQEGKLPEAGKLATTLEL